MQLSVDSTTAGRNDFSLKNDLSSLVHEISFRLGCMEFDGAYEPDDDSLKTLLLEMAQEHAVDPLLEMIVRQLARRPHVALAGIWLIQEGDCP